MKDRMKVALADIRYVQTEIEKILNRTSKGLRADLAEGRKSNEHSLKSSQLRSANFSTTPRKREEIPPRNTSPKRKKSEAVKVETFAASPPPGKSIFTIA